MKMKKEMTKKAITAACTAILIGMMTITSFAGAWRSDSNGWWWQNDNGSWPMNTWQWLDGDNNGVSECYYFDAHGYCLQDTKTPDGYYVNESGAWTENGAVQTRSNNYNGGSNNKGGSDDGAKADNTKTKALDLVTAKTVTGRFSTFTGRHTVQGDVLARGLMCGIKSNQAEYYVGEQYTTFAAKLAVSSDDYHSNNPNFLIEVLDKDLDVLDSVEVELRQAPQDFTVDISGTDYVTIRVTRIEGSNGTLLMENPVFK